MKRLSLFIITIFFSLNNVGQPSFSWAKQFGGGSDDEARAVNVDLSGNVYSTGSFEGIVDFNPNIGTFNLSSGGFNDIFISKLDGSGNFLWAKQIGGISYDRGYAISSDNFGNVYTIGIFQNTVDFDPGTGTYTLSSFGSTDIFISKLDSLGNFLWAKQIGGTFVDAAYSIDVDGSGNICVAGKFGGVCDFDPSVSTYTLDSGTNYDSFICKINASGNFVYAKQLLALNINEAFAIKLDALGNAYTTGHFDGLTDFDPGTGTYNMTSFALYDIFVLKLDILGNFVWAKQMGGNLNKQGTSITLDPSNNVYLTGDFEGTTDFDPGAGTFTMTSFGQNDIFLSKLDATGNFVWAKQMGGISYEGGSSIQLDGAGNVYTTGSFSTTADFDPGIGTFTLTSAGRGDIFISKLDASGNFVWAKQIGDTLNDHAYSLMLNSIGDIYCVGMFQGTVDFDPGASAYNLSSSGSYDIFVLKLNSGPTGIDEISLYNTLEIHPNPFNNRITIVSNGLRQTVQIFNTLGALVYNTAIENEKTEIDLNNQSAGIYFIRIGSLNRKIIKE